MVLPENTLEFDVHRCAQSNRCAQSKYAGKYRHVSTDEPKKTMETGLSGFHVGAPNGGLTNGKKTISVKSNPSFKIPDSHGFQMCPSFFPGGKKRKICTAARIFSPSGLKQLERTEPPGLTVLG
jgi:hypothetical protein